MGQHKDFSNEQEVASFAKKTGRNYAIFEGSVYDITDYQGVHPGGSDKLEPYLNRVIDEAFAEAGHTKSARLIFRELDKVGVLLGEGNSDKVNVKGLDGTLLESKLKLDFTKGMIYQIFTKDDITWEDYNNFINEPKHLVNPVREVKYFDTWWLEFFSKTPWQAIPIIYIPLSVWHMFLSVPYLPVALLFSYFVFGMLFWTFAEYMLHRFFFHAEEYWLPNHPKTLATHMLFHGFHHAFPMDRYRLVFPPFAGLSMFFLAISPAIACIVPNEAHGATISGFLIAYICYDLIHYYIHHGQPTDPYCKDMKRYHMLHHYKKGGEGFGLSNKLWDYVFGTVIKY